MCTANIRSSSGQHQKDENILPIWLRSSGRYSNAMIKQANLISTCQAIKSITGWMLEFSASINFSLQNFLLKNAMLNIKCCTVFGTGQIWSIKVEARKWFCKYKREIWSGHLGHNGGRQISSQYPSLSHTHIFQPKIQTLQRQYSQLRY